VVIWLRLQTPSAAARTLIPGWETKIPCAAPKTNKQTIKFLHFSHPYMTNGKTIALTRQTFVGKVMSLLFNMLSRFVIAFLPKS